MFIRLPSHHTLRRICTHGIEQEPVFIHWLIYALALPVLSLASSGGVLTTVYICDSLIRILLQDKKTKALEI